MKTGVSYMFWCLALITLRAEAAAIPDIQAYMSEVVKKDGVLLVRNDTREPYEVGVGSVGKYLMCLTTDLTTARMYLVTKDLFRKKQVSILVRCADGNLLVGPGYI